MNRKGFTLLELLIVVLIIGILTSVALPQYRFAVYKSRLVGLMPIMKAVKQANQAYYVLYGHYSYDFTTWDISLPPETRQTGGDSTSNIFLPNGAMLQTVSTTPAAGHVQGWFPEDTSARLWTAYQRDEWRCYPQGTALGQKMCKHICNVSTVSSYCNFEF